MKTITLISLMISSVAFAKTEPLSAKNALQGAVKSASRINQVVASVGVPGTGCHEEQIPLNRPVKSPDLSVPVIVCRPDSASLTSASTEDYSQLIRENNIEFVQPQAQVIASRDWRLFVHELKKFPADLLREMAASGGKIRVMIGNGVSEDPQWQVEKQRSVDGARRYWNWYHDPRRTPAEIAGKALPQTPEQAASGYENTVEGTRQWDVVSGAGGNFSDPNWLVPTRIVLNRMYFSANRGADGRITYDNIQGATNLFLHEHGHALDNLYGPHTISRSTDWQRVMRDPLVRAYLPKIFSDYEGRDEEGFAEAFSYYHSCEASRQQMETHAPELAAFFRDFNAQKLRALRPAR